MKISLHIGPHKTGTTTIQKCLRRSIGSYLPTPTWYPIYPDRNHNQIALDLVKQGDGAEFRRIFDKCREGGVEHLVLSAEAFCIAYPKRFENLAAAFDGQDVHLFATLTSPIRRAVSLWQEHVKHRHARGFEEQPHAILDHASMAPDLVPRFAETLSARSTTIIVASGDDEPEVLIHNLWRGLGLPLPIPELDLTNTSLGLIETETWRRLNALIAEHAPETPDRAYAKLRGMLAELFASDAWREVCPRIRIGTPDSFHEKLAAIAEQTMREVQAMQRDGKATVLGSIYALMEA